MIQEGTFRDCIEMVVQKLDRVKDAVGESYRFNDVCRDLLQKSTSCTL